MGFDSPDGVSRPLIYLAAENAVVGACIYDIRAMEHLADLRPEHFSSEQMQIIFGFLQKNYLSGRTADGIVLRRHLMTLGVFEEWGGDQYVSALLSRAAFGPEVKDYGRMITDLWCRRQLERTLKEATASLHGDADVDMITDRISNALSDVTQTSTRGEWVSSRVQAIQSVTKALEGGETAKARYGIPALDKRTGGLYGGDLVVLAGRPSMGKTAAANFIAASQDTEKVVGVFNLEMTNDQQGQRFASLQYHLKTGNSLPYTDIRRGHVPTGQHFARTFTEAMEKAPEVFWRSMPHASFAQINAAARDLKRKRGRIDLLVIDYLQLMRFAETRNGNRASDIGDVTSRLKALAVELDAPVILLSQLSRSVETRDNKRPVLSDLRDSGAIEQDADVVHFCFREHYYLDREGAPKNPEKIEAYEHRLLETAPQFLFLTPKLRMGVVGDDLVYWDAGHGAFFEERAMNLKTWSVAR